MYTHFRRCLSLGSSLTLGERSSRPRTGVNIHPFFMPLVIIRVADKPCLNHIACMFLESGRKYMQSPNGKNGGQICVCYGLAGLGPNCRGMRKQGRSALKNCFYFRNITRAKQGPFELKKIKNLNSRKSKNNRFKSTD